MMDVDPIYIVLVMAFIAVGVVVYVRAKREHRIKQVIVVPKAMTYPPRLDPPIPTIDQVEVKDKASRIRALKQMRDEGTISQVDYDTAKIKILFER